MSNLEELIEKLCPDEVEYKYLADAVTIKRGVRLIKKELKDNAKYPVYQNSLIPLGYYDDYNCEANKTMIITAGAAGDIVYSNTRFWAADDCFYFICNRYMDDKFLYYVLMSQQREIYSKVRKASIPRLPRIVIEKLKLPVPPLEVQREIVRILDNFTFLTTELAAELAARQKQYEYYRDLLLSFDVHTGGTNAYSIPWLGEMLHKLCPNGVEYKSLDELKKSNAVRVITPSFKIKCKDYQKNGNYAIVSQEADLISGYYNNFDVKLPLNQYICFGDHTEIIKYIDFKFVQGADGLKIMYVDKQRIIPKYLYYSIECFYKKHNNYERHFKYLLDTQIPIPPLAIQRRIVDILDRFDTICNDIFSGLPAEIEARQKQYEYYRDKLLTFKELKKEA